MKLTQINTNPAYLKKLSKGDRDAILFNMHAQIIIEIAKLAQKQCFWDMDDYEYLNSSMRAYSNDEISDEEIDKIIMQYYDYWCNKNTNAFITN